MEKKIINKIDTYLNTALGKLKNEKINFKEEGVVIEVKDSILIAKGFSNISNEECVIISKNYLGIVSVIDGDLIKIILLDKTNSIKVGDPVVRTFAPLSINVSEGIIGRVVDGLGRPIDEKGSIFADKKMLVERPAKGIMDRKSVTESLETGIKIVDALIPIGKGQRELILGDKQTGKTSIALDAIIHQKNTDVICIYCSIGQRDNATANIMKTLQENGAMGYTVIVQASGNQLAGHQYIAPYAATSIAEYFAEKGKHVLIVYDDLTKQARAYREVSLLLEKSPGREAYPADIFYAHSRLLERSTKLNDELGGGSITSLPIVETEAENISAYIPTNVISITDGQLYLSPLLYQKGILPAIDSGKSVSRVGSQAQLSAYKQAIGIMSIEYSQFEELEMFSKFATNLDEATEKIINKGQRIREVLKQRIFNTMTSSEQIAVFLATNANLLLRVPLTKINLAEKIIIDILNAEFDSMKKITKENKKIPQDIIDCFLLRVKDKIEQQPWII